eukprot:TRINITY_DN7992_c0_g2_i1.p1 TRINITY_DN7992_c0_g2~~TRINITY_DN7992_c0_g2_i1.p1  ORF type:complete len:163 (-),score=3.24 TRINITY_DN7992_c0_g2_i1:369-857(-)
MDAQTGRQQKRPQNQEIFKYGKANHFFLYIRCVKAKKIVKTYTYRKSTEQNKKKFDTALLRFSPMNKKKLLQVEKQLKNPNFKSFQQQRKLQQLKRNKICNQKRCKKCTTFFLVLHNYKIVFVQFPNKLKLQQFQPKNPLHFTVYAKNELRKTKNQKSASNK